jgi:predicted DCC family thiol-disulfide oxidoreductase YuxK
VARAILLYDRDCGFCRACLGVVLAWDRRHALRPLALQDPEAERLLGAMLDDERMASWHLVEDGGAVVSAGAAFAPLLRLLPGGRPLADIAESFPAATERAYRGVAGRRSLFGRALPDALKRRADALIAERERSGFPADSR